MCAGEVLHHQFSEWDPQFASNQRVTVLYWLVHKSVKEVKALRKKVEEKR